MTPDQVTAIGDVIEAGGGERAPEAPSRQYASRSSDPVRGLSARELAVLRLVAEGLSDADVASRLVLSPHTVRAHLRNIYSKIGVVSRSAATRYAADHDLL